MQLRLLGGEENGLLEFRDGIVSFLLYAEGASERLVSLPLLGSELYGDAKLGNCFIEATVGLKRLRQVRVSNWERRSEPDQNAEVDDGAVDVALLQQHLA